VDQFTVSRLLDAVAHGVVTANEATERLAGMPIQHLPFARVDTHRDLRTGMPEVIYAPGKTPDQIRAVAVKLLVHSASPVLATKAPPEVFDAVRDLTPEAAYHELARTIVLRAWSDAPLGTVAVVTAGTSDLPVAEEAAVTAEACGAKVERLADVGVAGLHRVVEAQQLLRSSDVLVVVAGTEGALPSVIAGLTAKPVVAVPTSVGYGAAFGGLAALLSMLNSCAPGVAVVNIDNGFGAAAFAIRLLKARA
jgi:hypothetical protein